MSINMFLGASDEQAESYERLVRRRTETLREVQQAIQNFVSDTESLKGKAYDSARSYYSEVLLPLAKGMEYLAEQTVAAVRKLPTQFRSEVDSADLMEWDLEEQIQQAEMLIQRYNDLIHSVSPLRLAQDAKKSLINGHTAMRDNISANKRLLEEKLQKLRRFHHSSRRLFSDLSSIEGDIMTGLQQAEYAWDSRSGVYILPDNRLWAQRLNEQYANKDLSPQEVQYIQNLKNQYGFDDETARQVLDVKQRIDRKFSRLSDEERDRLLLIALGSFVYKEASPTAGNPTDKFQGAISDYSWGDVAGRLADITGLPIDSSETFLKHLGLKDKAIAKLRYNIRLQGQIASGQYGDYDSLEKDFVPQFKTTYEQIYGQKLTDAEFEEKWNEKYQDFYDKGDFAHQAITMAANLNGSFRASDLTQGGHEKVNDFAGWLGDATLTDSNKISFGDDDYRADLDAVNVTQLMKEKGLSYLEASNHYYDGLYKGYYTRAEKFLEHKPLREVKTAVFDALIPQDMKKRTVVDGKVTIYEMPDESRCMDYLRKHYSDSYNFIRNLEKKENVLADHRGQ